MGFTGGAALRFTQLGLRSLQFACAAIILGIYSYFLAVLSKHDVPIPQWEKAVEGISGAAALYTLLCVLLTLFLGGVAVFGFIAIGLDLAFFATFIAILVLTRHGASRCTGIVDTPLGRGSSNEAAPGAGDFGYACSLNTAAFAVAVICMLLFLVTAPLQFILVKHHRKEKGLA